MVIDQGSYASRYLRVYGQVDNLTLLVRHRDGGAFTLTSGYVSIYNADRTAVLPSVATSIVTTSALLEYTLNVTSGTYPSGNYAVEWRWATTDSPGQFTIRTVGLIIKGRGIT